MSKEDFVSRYSGIVQYKIAPADEQEYERALAWMDGAEIDDNGLIVESPPETDRTNGTPKLERVRELATELILEAVPVEVKEDQPKLRGDGNLFYKGFRNFYDAYWGTCEVCEPYLLAGALTQVGAVLGRRACISMSTHASTRHTIYPNFYNAIIGITSIARKSSWLRQVEFDLSWVDSELKFMESVASAEGLILGLATDGTGDVIETYGQKYPEGQRLLLMIDEMKSLFMNSRRQITGTIIPKLTELYNCPRNPAVNTKTQPVVADHPVLNILAASTGEWLEDSVTESDLQGGFINRFAYWLYEFTPPKADPQDPHKEPLHQWYSDLGKLRTGDDTFRNFVLTQEAWEIYDEEYGKHRQAQWENQESFATKATAREMVHSFKIALAFAAIANDPFDNKVYPETYLMAREVAKYISQSNAYLFQFIGSGEQSKDETTILGKLSELENDTTRTALRRKIGGHTMSLDTFNKVLMTLENAGLIAVRDGRPQRIVRVEQ